MKNLMLSLLFVLASLCVSCSEDKAPVTKDGSVQDISVAKEVSTKVDAPAVKVDAQVVKADSAQVVADGKINKE